MVKCPVCDRIVYVGEHVTAMGRDFHPWCFRCANKSCKELLSEHDLYPEAGKLYCANCYYVLFPSTSAGLKTNDAGSGSKCKRD